jgi:hypothetical protein
MINGRWKLIALLLLSSFNMLGQEETPTGDSVLIEFKICKISIPIIWSFERIPRLLHTPSNIPVNAKHPLLSIAGELGYQYFGRESSADNLLLLNSNSHIATARLNVIYKETYPFSIYFRYNNTRPFQLDNQYEINISFDNRGFKELLRDKIAENIKNDFLKKQIQLLSRYEDLFKKFQSQKEMLKSPVYIQKVVQDRLRNRPQATMNMETTDVSRRLDGISGLLNQPLKAKDLVNAGLETAKKRIKDSIENRLSTIKSNMHTLLEEKRDSLSQLLKGLEDSLVSQKEIFSKQLDSLNNEMAELSSSDDLKQYANAKGVKDSLPENKWASLLMKTNIRLGKFILNNSELTISNIFLHGASIKYGEEKFIQVSGGVYDFAFRQAFRILGDSINKPHQSVFAIKLGKTDGHNLSAINFYIGGKEKPGTLTNELRTVTGVSIEQRVYFNKNITFDCELAKSSTRVNSITDKQQAALKDLVTNLNTRTFGLYGSLKASLPKTKTDAELSYRYWGQQFESFNASQYFTPQNNVETKLVQSLFKRKLYFSGGLRYTDFKSYGIASNMKTKAFFASANATLHIKHLPIISIGYYPGSQLYWLDNNKLYEYYYYIWNATASHYFNLGKMPFQAVLSYNKFFNKYTDSVVTGAQFYYNFFLTAWSGRFSYQVNYSHQQVDKNILTTFESGLNYSAKKIRIGGNAKWNFMETSMRLGYNVSFGLLIEKIGSVNFIYDRSFLADRRGLFIPIETGQIQIIKPLKFRIWQKG